MLLEKLTADLHQAQKANLSDRLSVLRMLLAQVKNREIEKRGKTGESTLEDTEVEEVLRREAKKRKEAAELFHKGGREDLADKEMKELATIETYLPAQMSEAEIEAVVASVRASGAGDFASIMREAMKQLKGKADGATVQQIIKKQLGA